MKRRKKHGPYMIQTHTHTNHTHEPLPINVEVNTAISEIRAASSSGYGSASSIIADAVKDMSDAGQASLPRMDSIRRTIRRQKGTTHINFRDREEIDLAPDLTITFK